MPTDAPQAPDALPTRPTCRLGDYGIEAGPEVGFDGRAFFAVATHDPSGRAYSKRQLASLKMWELRRRLGQMGAERSRVAPDALRDDAPDLMRQVMGQQARRPPERQATVLTKSGKRLTYRAKSSAPAAPLSPARTVLPSGRPVIVRHQDKLVMLPEGRRAGPAAPRNYPPPKLRREPKPTDTKGICKQLQALLADYHVAAKAEAQQGEPQSGASIQALREQVAELGVVAAAEQARPVRRKRPKAPKPRPQLVTAALRERLAQQRMQMLSRIPEALRPLAQELAQKIKRGVQAGALGSDPRAV